MPDYDAKKVQELVAKVNHYQVLPKGYMTVTMFARQCGVTFRSVHNSVMTGRIPIDYCAAIPRGKKWSLIISEEAIPIFCDGAIAKGHVAESRIPPKTLAEVREPVDTPDSADSDNGAGDVDDDEIDVDAIDTLADARIAVEKIKLRKMQAELRIANNETITVADARDAGQVWGLALLSATQRAINRMSSMLVPCDTAVRCRKVLENELRDVFNIMKGDYLDVESWQTEEEGSD